MKLRSGQAAAPVGRKKLQRWLILIVLLALGAGLALALWPNRRILSGWEPTPPAERRDVFLELEKSALELTDEDLVGQLLVVGLDGTSLQEGTLRRLSELRPAGVILFGRNIQNPAQLRALTGGLQQAAAELGLPGLLVAVDQEGGRVRRLKRGFSYIPPMAELAEVSDVDGAFVVGRVIGRELAAVGCNWNLAPVVDVLTNPANPGIGDRAFSGDPDVVAAYGAALADGLNAAGVACCAKHFPGKGEASLDAHYDLPVIPVDEAHLRNYEWPPFTALLADNHPARAAMVSHVVIPALDDALPASLSPVAYRVLRAEIGFDGPAITDDLEMGAIVEDYAVGGAARMAIVAGADLALVCHDGAAMSAARRALLEALENGDVTREALARKVVRVWALKLALGLPLPGLADYQTAFDDLYTRRGLDPAPARTVRDEEIALDVCGSAEHRRELEAALEP
ncbi:MAG: beta-N-acetylhexosaminidase [Candidatus Coatesbacteria bacterium]|nr:beta-N-acetylhexosaminidase [Candidatus Coatesbacteria bacterium]